MGIDGHELAYARHPSCRDNERQSEICDLSAVAKHPFLHKRQACDIDIVTAPSKSRLGDAILQYHHRSGAIHNNRTLAAKVVQRAAIKNIKMCRRHSATEFSC